MLKKLNYAEPEMEITYLTDVDVICTSDDDPFDDNTGSGTGGDGN